jgi:hypothetical protein
MADKKPWEMSYDVEDTDVKSAPWESNYSAPSVEDQSAMANYDISVPTDENIEFEGSDPYQFIKNPSIIQEGQALAEVPIQLGSDVVSGVSAGTRKSASKINLIPQIILSKITGQNMIDQSALDAANKPLMQMYDESALQYDASPLGKRRYESFLENIQAIPAFNELRAYNMLNKGRKESEFFNAAKNQELLKKAKQSSNQTKVLKESSAEGYVVTPSKVKNSSKKDLAAESTAGKFQSEEMARFKNQEITDKLVKKYLGLTDDASLDKDAIDLVRKKHGSAYNNIEKLKGKVDVKTTGTGGLYNKPQTTKTIIHRDGKDILEDIKTARDAERELWKNYRFGTNAGKTEQLNEARKKTDEVIQLEKELDGLLAFHKKPELANKLKKARQDIAKVYLVDDAMTATGRVDATKFAKGIKKKYMTGEAKKIAKFADQYPQLAKPPQSQSLKDVTSLDLAFILQNLGLRNYKTAAAALMRPLSKNRLFTKGAQERIINRQINPTNFQGSALLSPPTKTEYAAEGLGLASLLDPYFNR